MIPMDRKAAFIILGLDPRTKAKQIEKACERKWRTVHDLMIDAPGDLLREVYSLELAQIEEAREVVLGKSTTSGSDRSATELGDLPSQNAVLSRCGTSVASTTVAQATLGPGKVLKERYIIVKLIGAGGMGVVYEAFDRVRSHKIAIKVIFPLLMAKAEAPVRFRTDAKITSDLSHPHIVNVYDAQCDGDLYFLTMELLKGQTLRQEMEERVRAQQPFDIEDVRRVGRCLGDALEYAHQFAIHRNIKPENIWVAPDGTIKLMDFGFSWLMIPSRPTGTVTAAGISHYMAPEAVKRAKNVDWRVDQYSVAAILYEMLTGVVPVGRVEAANKVRSDVPQTLSRCLARTLSSGPEDRFKEMKEFRAALLGPSKAMMVDFEQGQQIPTILKSIATRRLALVGVCVIAAIVLATTPWWWTGLNDRFEAPRYEKSWERGNAATANKNLAEAPKASQAVLSAKVDDTAGRERQDQPQKEPDRTQELLMERGSSALNQQRWGDAVATSQAELETKPIAMSARPHLEQAETEYDVAKQEQEIEKKYVAALEPDHSALHQQRSGEVTASLQPALEKNPNGEAQKGYDKARDENHSAFSEAMWRGRMALRLQKWTDAIKAFQNALKIEPNSMSAQQYLEQAEAGYGKTKQGHEIEKKYAAAMERGSLALNQGEWTGAIAAFRDALRFKPRDRVAIVGLNKAEKGRHATGQ